MQLIIGEGVLVFDYKSFAITDGIEYYRNVSPQLLFRLLYKKKKRDKVHGKWWMISNMIIWFRKERYHPG